MADGGESDVASANAFVFSEKGDASPGEGTETTISSRIWARRRARDRVWIARTHLNPGGEVHGSFHGDAVHGVEHHAQVVGGGDEHPGHLSGQAEHAHAVFGVGLRLRPREQVDGVRLSLRSRRARDIGKGSASDGDRTETRVAIRRTTRVCSEGKQPSLLAAAGADDVENSRGVPGRRRVPHL